MKRLLRSLAKGVGHLLLGGAVALLVFAVALLSIGLYLVSVPYSRMSRKHAQLQALVQAAQAGAALFAVMRQAAPDDELDSPELDDR